MIALPISLRVHAERYAIERGLAPATRKLHRYVLNHFERFLERPGTVADLTPEAINRWLLAQSDAGMAAETMRTYRRALLALWRDAAESGQTSAPANIRKIKPSLAVPVCWSLQELALLLAACDGLSGRMHSDTGVSRAAFWRTFVLVGYETGLRLGDLLDLRTPAEGMATIIIQRKTGERITFRLSPQTMALIQLLGKRRRLFGDLICRRNAQEYFAKIVARAGLVGSPKWLRRSGATFCEVQQPGSAMAYLGHKTPGLAYKNYVDFRFLWQNKPLPPPIPRTE